MITSTPTDTTRRSDRVRGFRQLLAELAAVSDEAFEGTEVGALPPVVVTVRVHVRRAEELHVGGASGRT